MSDVGDIEIERFLRSHGPFEEPPLLAFGDCVGDWEICAFLGHGGSAQVYRAENITTGLVAALKILFRSDDRTRVRFKREARLLAEVRSSSFPKFYGAGEYGGRLYIAEELLEPMQLPDDDEAVARFVLAVADAVEELHQRGFIHRDIKPGNVMMRPATGESVLIDMGLAKESAGAPDAANDTTSVVDGHAVGVGTPGFSAPEQFTGGAIGPAADIHALGILANACFDGKPPRSWTRIIRRSTSSIPEQRYHSVSEFVRAIRSRHVTRRWLTGIIAVIVVIVIISILLLQHGSVAEKQETSNAPQVEETVKTDRDVRPARPQSHVTRDPTSSVGSIATASEDKSRKQEGGKVLTQKDLAEALLEATYDLQYKGNTNLNKKAALETMRKGILPSF